MRKKLKKIRIYIYKIFIILVFFILIILSLYYLVKYFLDNSNIFLIKNIKAREEFKKELEYLKYKSLLNVDIKDVYFKIYRNHPEYKEIFIIKEFPSSIRIDIKLREPFCQLELGNFYILDKEGFVIDIRDNQLKDVILIKFNSFKYPLKKCFKINDSNLNTAFKLIDEINKNNFIKKLPIKFIDITNPLEICFFIDNTKIILTENFKKKLEILEDILISELKNDLKSVDYIDLRFDKVYISYRKQL